jgi:hypothetical protein
MAHLGAAVTTGYSEVLHSFEVDAVLGWRSRKPSLRSWLVASGFSSEPLDKPKRPKEAVEQALRFVRKARSSALYRQLAERVSLRRCTDPAFSKLMRVLRNWFPIARSRELVE